MLFRKILCPIDFSPGSEQAMRAAVRLANESGAELVLLHAWHVPPMAYGAEYAFAAEVMVEVQDGAEEALEHATREATRLGATRLSSRLVSGAAPHAIVEVLEEDPELDLVVMGTHGRTGLARVLLGSVAEGVVRRAPCSVLVVRPDGEVPPFTRALCPVDFSGPAQQAAELAVRLVEPGGAGITLLHVIELPPVYARKGRTLELVRDLDRFAAEHLERWAADLAARTPVPIAKLTRIGHAGAEILKLLDEDPAFDLVVMGSHGRTGLERALLGSVAEKVVRHASRPVLVARRRDQPRPADDLGGAVVAV